MPVERESSRRARTSFPIFLCLKKHIMLCDDCGRHTCFTHERMPMSKFVSFVLIVAALLVGCGASPAAAPAPASRSNNPRVNVRQPTVPSNQANIEAITPAAQPQSQGLCGSKLTGRVFDKQGKALANINVEIKSDDLSYNTITDDNGSYGLGAVCGGNYEISVTLSGQAPQLTKARAALDGAHDLKVDVKLE